MYLAGSYLSKVISINKEIKLKDLIDRFKIFSENCLIRHGWSRFN